MVHWHDSRRTVRRRRRFLRQRPCDLAKRLTLSCPSTPVRNWCQSPLVDRELNGLVLIAPNSVPKLAKALRHDCQHNASAGQSLALAAIDNLLTYLEPWCWHGECGVMSLACAR